MNNLRGDIKKQLIKESEKSLTERDRERREREKGG
jgi:hypothetical protein